MPFVVVTEGERKGEGIATRMYTMKIVVFGRGNRSRVSQPIITGINAPLVFLCIHQPNPQSNYTNPNIPASEIIFDVCICLGDHDLLIG